MFFLKSIDFLIKSCYLYGVSIEDVMLIIDYGGNKK